MLRGVEGFEGFVTQGAGPFVSVVRKRSNSAYAIEQTCKIRQGSREFTHRGNVPMQQGGQHSSGGEDESMKQIHTSPTYLLCQHSSLHLSK